MGQTIKAALAIAALAGLFVPLSSATEPVESVEPDRPESLASMMQLFVYPEAGQSAEQEFADEVDCYDWAHDIVGADPFRLEKEVKKRKKSLPEGRPRNEADPPAEYGNAIELNRGKTQKTKAARDQTEEFRKLFGVCLDSKNYTVRHRPG